MFVGESECVLVEPDEGDSFRLIGGKAGVKEDDEEGDMAEVDATGSAWSRPVCACERGVSGFGLSLPLPGLMPFFSISISRNALKPLRDETLSLRICAALPVRPFSLIFISQ